MNLSEEMELVKIVAEDLKFLQDEWDEEITDASLRNSSAVLRKLLVEDEYGRAWRTTIIGFQKQPKVSAVDSDKYMLNANPEIPIKKIKFAVMGGAVYKGLAIQGLRYGNYAPSQTSLLREKKRTEYLINNPRKYMLKDFMESVACVIDGKKISRRDIIQYVTNKKGGVHIDFKRNRPLDKKFKLIDRSYSRFYIYDKNYVYYELLSIGQTIAHSEDAKLFIDKASSLGLLVA